MRLGKRPEPLFLLLLPFFATALAAPPHEIAQAALSSTQLRKAIPDPVSDVNTKSKYEVGTKDAPVDGKDGKPHAGPWVGAEKESKKAKQASKDGEIAQQKQMHKAELITPDGERIPAVNDGVMDDPSREPPKHGTTGTEGGVSKKDQARKAQEVQTGERLENKPASPKEAPTLPHGDQSKNEKLKSNDVEDLNKETKDSLAGLEKPDNLPEKPHNLPQPLPNSAQKDHLDIVKPDTKSNFNYDLQSTEGNEGLIQPLHSYFLSLIMILFSEIGDKTFIIAALMAMKHDRLLVFSAAFSALLVMTVLSAVLGHAVPTLIPKRITNFLASGLFLVFGGRMLKEGLVMSPDEGVAAEMKEVEMELQEKEHIAIQQGLCRSSVSPHALEMGLGRSRTRKSRSSSRLPSLPRSPSSSPDRSPSPKRSMVTGATGGLANLLSLLLSPAWVQTFVMTFLGEWGDRSQIATIAMAAGQDYWWVTGGAVSGHAFCTGVAVIGGRAIAGRVSLRVVTLGGAFAFLIFGVIYLIEACYA